MDNLTQKRLDLLAGIASPNICIDDKDFFFNPKNLKYKQIQELKSKFLVGIKMNANMEPDLTSDGAISKLMVNLENVKQELIKILWCLPKDSNFDEVDYVTYNNLLEPVDTLDPLNLNKKKED